MNKLSAYLAENNPDFITGKMFNELSNLHPNLAGKVLKKNNYYKINNPNSKNGRFTANGQKITYYGKAGITADFIKDSIIESGLS